MSSRMIVREVVFGYKDRTRAQRSPGSLEAVVPDSYPFVTTHYGPSTTFGRSY